VPGSLSQATARDKSMMRHHWLRSTVGALPCLPSGAGCEEYPGRRSEVGASFCRTAGVSTDSFERPEENRCVDDQPCLGSECPNVFVLAVQDRLSG
jgi:hypothetical protein